MISSIRSVMIETLNQNTTQLEFLSRVVDEQPRVVEENRACFKNISTACKDTKE